MHTLDLVKPDGRSLTLYSRVPLAAVAEAPSPFAEPLGAAPHFRWHPLRGEWVAYAAYRQNRTFQPPPEYNPLAVTLDPAAPTELPAGEYDIAVFENRFPAMNAAGVTAPVEQPGDEFDAGPGSEPIPEPEPETAPDLEFSPAVSGGRCEVVVFSRDPFTSLGRLPLRHIELLLQVWADRTARAAAEGGLTYVLPFENRGVEVGVTLHHPHGQIYAYPYITPRTTTLLRSIDSYGPTLFADILESERTGPRVVLAAEHFTAFVPFAARWPVEVHLLPHRHVPDFAALTDEERDELAVVYRRILRGLDALYDDPTPYIAAWHQAPVTVGRDTVRLNLQITSPRRAETKLKFLAGSEAAMGAWIGDLVPETQAEKIREAIERA